MFPIFDCLNHSFFMICWKLLYIYNNHVTFFESALILHMNVRSNHSCYHPKFCSIKHYPGIFCCEVILLSVCIGSWLQRTAWMRREGWVRSIESTSVLHRHWVGHVTFATAPRDYAVSASKLRKFWKLMGSIQGI